MVLGFAGSGEGRHRGSSEALKGRIAENVTGEYPQESITGLLATAYASIVEQSVPVEASPLSLPGLLVKPRKLHHAKPKSVVNVLK